MVANAEDAPRGIHRRLQIELTTSLVSRFNDRLDKSGECWTWTASQRNGYGAIKHQGRVLSAHVLAWVIDTGRQVPPGSIVTHACDNKLCCRVHTGHVGLGTPTSNVREMYARINVYKARGEQAYNACLTEEQVRFALAANVLNGAGARRLSSVLGCSLSALRSVLDRSSWNHVAVPTKEEAAAIVEAFTTPTP